MNPNLEKDFETAIARIEKIKKAFDILIGEDVTDVVCAISVDYDTLELLSNHYNELMSRYSGNNLHNIIIDYKGCSIQVQEFAYAEMIEHKIKSENPTV